MYDSCQSARRRAGDATPPQHTDTQLLSLRCRSPLTPNSALPRPAPSAHLSRAPRGTDQSPRGTKRPWFPHWTPAVWNLVVLKVPGACFRPCWESENSRWYFLTALRSLKYDKTCGKLPYLFIPFRSRCRTAITYETRTLPPPLISREQILCRFKLGFFCPFYNSANHVTCTVFDNKYFGGKVNENVYSDFLISINEFFFFFLSIAVTFMFYGIPD